MKESWDILIILDACRYDYFEKVCREYFNGYLTKRISPGTWTLEWGTNVFTGVYNNVVYVSGNPYIRNTNISMDLIKIQRGAQLISKGFISEKHFYKIIDVHFDKWDEEFKTVLPESMNQAALYARKNYPDKKLIIHYIQPHGPFLDLDWVNNNYPLRLRDRIKAFILWKLIKVFSRERWLKICRKLRILLIPRQIEFFANKHGLDALREMYEEHLRNVLRYVKDLIDYLEGKIVITADHGEMLGEYGKFSHWDIEKKRYSELIEIPWLEITRNKAIKKIPDKIDYEELPMLSESEEEIIMKRLEALGYI